MVGQMTITANVFDGIADFFEGLFLEPPAQHRCRSTTEGTSFGLKSHLNPSSIGIGTYPEGYSIPTQSVFNVLRDRLSI
jgi:hypothetical protein